MRWGIGLAVVIAIAHAGSAAAGTLCVPNTSIPGCPVSAAAEPTAGRRRGATATPRSPRRGRRGPDAAPEGGGRAAPARRGGGAAGGGGGGPGGGEGGGVVGAGAFVGL